MQELLVDFITSLDGYGAAEGWPGFWGLQGPTISPGSASSPSAQRGMRADSCKARVVLLALALHWVP